MAAIASVGTPTLRFGAVRSATKATVARAPLGACLTARTIGPERSARGLVGVTSSTFASPIAARARREARGTARISRVRDEAPFARVRAGARAPARFSRLDDAPGGAAPLKNPSPPPMFFRSTRELTPRPLELASQALSFAPRSPSPPARAR